MEFEWDPVKAAANLEKHRISFREATFIFDDPFALRANDRKHSTKKEVRYVQIGETLGAVLVVIFTIRMRNKKEVWRIISARRASRRERALYEINKRIPVS